MLLTIFFAIIEIIQVFRRERIMLSANEHFIYLYLTVKPSRHYWVFLLNYDLGDFYAKTKTP